MGSSVKATAFYNIVIGQNCFCCLCFQTVADSAVHMKDEIFITLKDKERIHIIVEDMLLEVLGAQLFNQLSAFGSICNQCLSQAMKSLKFIRTCKNNIQTLCKNVENFTMCIKDATAGIKEEYKAAYVSMDTKRSIWNKYYSKKSFQNCSKAFAMFITIEYEQKLFEYKKRQNVKKRLPKITLIRLEDEIKWQHSACKLFQAKITHHKNTKHYSEKSQKPKPKILQDKNKGKMKMPQNVCVESINDRVSNVSWQNTNTNKQEIINNDNKKKPSEIPQNIHVNEINDSDNGRSGLKRKPNIVGIINDNYKKTASGIPQNVHINKVNDSHNGISGLKTKPNIVEITNENYKETASEIPQNVFVNVTIDGAYGICRPKTKPNILRNSYHRKKKRLLEYLPDVYVNLNEHCDIKDTKLNDDSKTLSKTSEESILLNSSQIYTSYMQSQIFATEVELEQFHEITDEILQCQFCELICYNSEQLTNHLKTHDRSMIIESIIKV